MKIFRIYLLIILLIASACSTDAELAFQDWDENKDEIITYAEYLETKPYLNLFSQWDKDDNSLIPDEEWREGVNSFYPGKTKNDYYSFSEWDIDNDGSLTSGEFAQRTFVLWDMNKDNTLSFEEFEEWYPEY